MYGYFHNLESLDTYNVQKYNVNCALNKNDININIVMNETHCVLAMYHSNIKYRILNNAVVTSTYGPTLNSCILQN